jgi:hypothetical protein
LSASFYTRLQDSKRSFINGDKIWFEHGASTPLKNWDQFGKYFPTFSQGQITTNGWRQEILLGKYMRHKYIHNKYNEEYRDFTNLDRLHEVFLISSPTHRTIEFCDRLFIRSLP